MVKVTRTAGALLLLSAFMACSKKDEPAPAASVTPAAQQAAEAAASAALAQAQAAASAAQAAAAAAGAAAVEAGVATPELGAVKRFPGKEKAATGTTKVLLEASKIFDEPDNTQPQVATLSKDLVVTKLATLDSGWTLIEFPSGIGKVSPAWIESKDLVGSVAAAATSAKPAASVASAKPATSAAPVASAKPAASATAAPSPALLRSPGANPAGSCSGRADSADRNPARRMARDSETRGLIWPLLRQRETSLPVYDLHARAARSGRGLRFV